MRALYLVNPDRYPWPKLFNQPLVKFAWTRSHLNKTGLNIEAWKLRMGAQNRDHVIVKNPKLMTDFKASGMWGDDITFHEQYFDPVSVTNRGYVLLPSGAQVRISRTLDEWLDMYDSIEYDQDNFRELFNAFSAVWSHGNLSISTTAVDYIPDDMLPEGYDDKSFTKGEDCRVVCDTCVFRDHCYYAMEGAVCILPRSEPSTFAQLMGSRDSKDILKGLSMIVQKNAERFDLAVGKEVPGEPSKEVTGLSNTLFGQAVQLAKLLDPSLRASPKIQIGINAGTGSVSVDGEIQGGFSQTQLAGAMKELQRYDVPLEEIDEDLLMDYLVAREDGNTQKIAELVAGKTGVINADEDTVSPF